MKPLFRILLVLVLSTATKASVAQLSKEQIEEQRFAELLKRAKTNIVKTREVQKKAAQKTTALVTQAKTKITTLNTNVKELKVDVKELKVDLNETAKKLDYATDTNIGIKFILLPISDTQKIRQ